MIDYKELTETVDIPLNAGKEGFILGIRRILDLSRVTHFECDLKGKLRYTRFVRAEEPRKNIDYDFESVSPGAIVRNIDIEEVDSFHSLDNAAVCVAMLFFAAERDHMVPVAFVTGANPVFPEWHQRTTGVRVSRDNAYGLPIYRDRFIPDETLLMVVAYSKDAGLIDASKSYKIALPLREHLGAAKKEVIIETPLMIEQLPSSETYMLASPPLEDEVKVT